MKKFLKKAAMISAITLMAQLLLVPGMAMAEAGETVIVNVTTAKIKTVIKDNETTPAAAETVAVVTEEAVVSVAPAEETTPIAPLMENLENRVNKVNGFAGGEPQN